MCEIDWSPLIEILKLVASPLGAVAGAFLGSYLASYWAEKRRNRREHFDRLKEAIFNPWKSDLHFHNLEYCIRTSYGSPLDVRRLEVLVQSNVLFEDVKNHFPDLFHQWVRIKRNFSRYYEDCLSLARRIEKILVEKTGLHMIIRLEKEKGFMHDFVRITYNSLIDLVHKKELSDKKLEIIESKDIYELKYKGTTMAQGPREELERCKSAIKDALEMPECKRRAQELIKKVEVLTRNVENFKRRLNQIIEATKLPGDCSYI